MNRTTFVAEAVANGFRSFLATPTVRRFSSWTPGLGEHTNFRAIALVEENKQKALTEYNAQQHHSNEPPTVIRLGDGKASSGPPKVDMTGPVKEFVAIPKPTEAEFSAFSKIVPFQLYQLLDHNNNGKIGMCDFSHINDADGSFGQVQRLNMIAKQHIHDSRADDSEKALASAVTKYIDECIDLHKIRADVPKEIARGMRIINRSLDKTGEDNFKFFLFASKYGKYLSDVFNISLESTQLRVVGQTIDIDQYFPNKKSEFILDAQQMLVEILFSAFKESPHESVRKAAGEALVVRARSICRHIHDLANEELYVRVTLQKRIESMVHQIKSVIPFEAMNKEKEKLDEAIRRNHIQDKH